MKLRNIKLMFLLILTGAAQAEPVITVEDLKENLIPFNSPPWDLTNAKTVAIDGRQAITGSAILREAMFENGIIEMELKSDGSRAFPGITFRDDAKGNGETIYVRPHHSGQYDAVQYAPVFNDQTGWQLYHGEGFTAGVNIPGNQWIKLRVEVKNSKARVFVNDMNSPALLISNLKGKPEAGRITITDGDKGVYLANFRMKKTSDLSFAETPVVTQPVEGLLTWEISKSFSLNNPAGKNITSLGSNRNEWTPVGAEPSGLVNLSRHLALVNGEPSVAYARAILKSEKKKRVKFEFGYSDNITIFHNRRPIYSGKAGFHSREPQFNGLIGYNDAVYIDLAKGDNEILLELTENFGGWGFMMHKVPDQQVAE